MAGGTSVFTIKILPHFKAFNEYGASAYILIVINLVFFITCSKKDPGVVSQENVSTFLAAYEPDGLFYTENQCYTCEIIKPARSKHCCKLRLMYMKVARQNKSLNTCDSDNPPNSRFNFNCTFSFNEIIFCVMFS